MTRLSDLLADMFKTYDEISCTRYQNCVAIALLAEQAEKIHRAVLVCSRLVAGAAVSPTARKQPRKVSLHFIKVYLFQSN